MKVKPTDKPILISDNIHKQLKAHCRIHKYSMKLYITTIIHDALRKNISVQKTITYELVQQ